MAGDAAYPLVIIIMPLFYFTTPTYFVFRYDLKMFDGTVGAVTKWFVFCVVSRVRSLAYRLFGVWVCPYKICSCEHIHNTEEMLVQIKRNVLMSHFENTGYWNLWRNIARSLNISEPYLSILTDAAAGYPPGDNLSIALEHLHVHRILDLSPLRILKPWASLIFKVFLIGSVTAAHNYIGISLLHIIYVMYLYYYVIGRYFEKGKMING